MRARVLLLSSCLYFACVATGCNKPPSNSSGPAAANETQTPSDQQAPTAETSEQKEYERNEAKNEHLVVPAGTAITISLGSSVGSKISRPGDTFSGTVARDVMAGNTVAIPRGASVTGTVEDAKPLGRFKGGAVLKVRLDSVRIHGTELPVQARARSFSEKGKGKRTAVLAGGGAALGGIIGALAGGGKGAAIGMAAGGGAGATGAAFTGNKEIVLPAESALTFDLSQPLEAK